MSNKLFSDNYIDKLRQRKSKSGGAYYEWQDMAVRYAKEFGFSPTPSWFKTFKINSKSKLEKAYRKMVDSPTQFKNPEKYFYKLLSIS